MGGSVDELIAEHPPVPMDEATPDERVLMGSLLSMLRGTRWGHVTISVEAGRATRVEQDMGWKLR